jgi:hypothetical protein
LKFVSLADAFEANGIFRRNTVLAEQIAQLVKKAKRRRGIVLGKPDAGQSRMSRLYFGDLQRAVIHKHDTLRSDVPRLQNARHRFLPYLYPIERVAAHIYVIRGENVMLEIRDRGRYMLYAERGEFPSP